MFNDLLAPLGLNNGETKVYSALLQNGPQTGRQLTVGSNLSRTNIYNIVANLEKKGLIEQTKNGKKTLFSPLHPNKLENLIENKEKQLKHAKTTLISNLPELVSKYNLAIGKPGIKFFEGEKGIQKILEDSLTSKEEILTYMDIESIVKHIDSINKDYVKKIDKAGIKKRAILLDTPFARKYLQNCHKKITNIKLITYDAPPFQTIMQIYDNKISYITLTDKAMLSVIIEDPNIYKMHKYIFEYLWRIAPETTL